MRKNTLPAKPDDYKVELPKDFVVPQGVEFKLDEADPLLVEGRKLAHEFGLTPEQFNKLVAVKASADIANVQNLNTARKAEIDKLGANGTTRVTAVQTWLTGMLGEQAAKHMATMLVTAAHVEGFEKLIRSYTTQGAPNFRQNGRTPESSGVDDATYKSWTFSQRQNYARTGDPNKAA